MKRLIAVAAIAVFVLAGCEGNVATTGSTDPPVIKSFIADPPSITRGNSAQIIWQVSNAKKVVYR
jgi:hypothetical protein